MKKTQSGAIPGWALWALLGMATLVALAAFGTWHAMQALDSLGVVRVTVEGQEVLNGVRWSDFSDGERVSFALLIGFTLLLVLLVVLPLVFVGALVIPLFVTLVVVAVSLAPIVLPIAFVVWLVRRARRSAPTPPTATMG